MIEQLKTIDNQIFLALNGSESAYWDGVMWTVTNTLTWIPLLLVLLYVVMKNSDMSRLLLVIAAMALTILIADRLSSGLIKPLVMRWRPTHDVTFYNTIDTVFGYKGGRYGFVSSHAANTFSIFIFLSLLLRSRLMTFCLFLWAVIASFSRIYLGVHFPGDILCGALLGVLVGMFTYFLFSLLNNRIAGGRQYYSTAYTTSGFLYSDMHLLAFVLMATYCVVLLIAIPIASK